MNADTLAALAELHRIRIASISDGTWPAASLELWGDVIDHPDDWPDITVERAREVLAAYEQMVLHPPDDDRRAS